MAICNSCGSIRLGDGSGDTLMEALGAVYNVSLKVPAMAYQMMESIIPQAKKRGVCPSCMNDLQYLKSEIGKNS